eukprot:1763509-Alexandrium_andersonii.AAC.1
MENGMGQAKFRLPRTAFRGGHAAKAMGSLLRPPLEGQIIVVANKLADIPIIQRGWGRSPGSRPPIE